MNALTVVSTDLLTPLGAYLRLREGGRASFLLESVEKGRLGRHSFVGCGDRIVSFEEAEQLGEAVVGYLGYDHIAKLERTVPLPKEGPDVPESRFVVADLFLRDGRNEPRSRLPRVGPPTRSADHPEQAAPPPKEMTDRPLALAPAAW